MGHFDFITRGDLFCRLKTTDSLVVYHHPNENPQNEGKSRGYFYVVKGKQIIALMFCVLFMIGHKATGKAHHK